ncbi:hypothetical protein [Phytohabitans kaempferiae]|uniref:HTH iclR-type domain-containing protein n=1 Tax=Phytohabitans kaempferiae TaxID=1620943 RepID=A0ABV6MHY6_9ACTN
MKLRIAGRGWAYVGALLGGGVSVAANVAHSYVPPSGAPDGWQPQTGAVVGAVFWPLALFVAVEILTRVPWPSGARWAILRYVGLLPVAVVAAVVSYRHLSGLLAFYSEDPLTVAIGPLAVDGLMVMATGALLATGTRRAVATDAPAVPIPAVAPVAAPAIDPAPVTSAPKSTGNASRPQVARKAPSADKVAKAAAKMPGATIAAIAAKAGVSESTARRYLPTVRPAESAATVASATPARPAATPALADAA